MHVRTARKMDMNGLFNISVSNCAELFLHGRWLRVPPSRHCSHFTVSVSYLTEFQRAQLHYPLVLTLPSQLLTRFNCSTLTCRTFESNYTRVCVCVCKLNKFLDTLKSPVYNDGSVNSICSSLVIIQCERMRII